MAKKWVDADAAARLLEDTKAEVFAERKNALVIADSKLSDAAADRIARANPEWLAWKKDMVEARTQANLLKVQLRYIEMRFWEQGSLEATQRAEMKL